MCSSPKLLNLNLKFSYFPGGGWWVLTWFLNAKFYATKSCLFQTPTDPPYAILCKRGPELIFSFTKFLLCKAINYFCSVSVHTYSSHCKIPECRKSIHSNALCTLRQVHSIMTSYYTKSIPIFTYCSSICSTIHT